MKRSKALEWCLVILITMGIDSCREEFIPPTITVDHNYLVVEGFINPGADSSTFKLSRTQPPGSSTGSGSREAGARLQILSGTGVTLSAAVESSPGTYRLFTATLDPSGTYQLKISTGDGKEYLSDPVTSKETPGIDSLTWRYDPVLNLVNFYANAHDALNATRYYRWEYSETWQYQALYDTRLKFDGINVVDRLPEEQIYNCWSTRLSNEILIGSSAALSNDVILDNLIYTIPFGSNRFNIRYSIELTQYGMTQEAYAYWQSLKRMNESGGSIFDAQPTELIGNIHSISEPGEPVIGYFSAQTIARERIFINRGEIREFIVGFPYECEEQTATLTSPASLRELFLAGSWIPIYYDGPDGVVGSSINCVDCRSFGGTTTKPSFW